MKTERVNDVLAKDVRARLPALREQFLMATPFPHILIEDFFEPEFARDLVNQFPAFDSRRAINEFGRVGGKAARPELEKLGPAFSRASSFFASSDFLSWLTDLTGIPDLQYDPVNFGGGTHENLDGQELLPHVDFNNHPETGYHRRLNVIVYLNDGWQPEWGGSIRVHSNPRDHLNDKTKAYLPLFNHCIIFETSERSWHSFDKIRLPECEKRRQSRKSLSIYLYTRERPKEETFARHTTFYVPRPLPSEFVAGKTLSDDDIRNLQSLLLARDELIKLHQLKESEKEPSTILAQQRLIQINELLGKIRLPLVGYGLVIGKTAGFYVDGWSAPNATFSIKAIKNTREVIFTGRVHERMPANTTLSLTLNGSPAYSKALTTNDFSITMPVTIAAGETAMIGISTNHSVNLKALDISEDVRDLAVLFDAITLVHS